MEWVIENKEWLFSGIGLLAITGIAGLFVKKSNSKSHQSIHSGYNSTNIQNSRDVKVRNGKAHDGK